jgi:uncharacterized repeat protein (TIGR01451 family)
MRQAWYRRVVWAVSVAGLVASAAPALADVTVSTVGVSSSPAAVLPGGVVAGGVVSYQVAVANTDPSAAALGVQVADAVPAGVLNPSICVSLANAPCAPGSGFAGTGPVNVGDLAAGTGATVWVSGVLDPSLATGSPLLADAPSASYADPTGLPVSVAGSGIGATVEAQADIALALASQSPAGAVAGGGATTASFTVHNSGPSDAASPVLTLTLPNGLSNAMACLGSPCTPATALGADGTVSLGASLAAGATAYVTVSATVAAGLPAGPDQTLVAQATASSSTLASSALDARGPVTWTTTYATVAAAPAASGVFPGNGSIYLTWNAPRSTGGAPLLGYCVTPGVVGPGTACTGTLVPLSTGRSDGWFIYRVRGLANNIPATFTVQPDTVLGTGSPDTQTTTPSSRSSATSAYDSSSVFNNLIASNTGNDDGGGVRLGSSTMTVPFPYPGGLITATAGGGPSGPCGGLPCGAVVTSGMRGVAGPVTRTGRPWLVTTTLIPTTATGGRTNYDAWVTQGSTGVGMEFLDGPDLLHFGSAPALAPPCAAATAVPCVQRIARSDGRIVVTMQVPASVPLVAIGFRVRTG